MAEILRPPLPLMPVNVADDLLGQIKDVLPCQARLRRPLRRNPWEAAMPLGEICNRTVVVVTRDTRIDEAARLMRENHVGSLVVVDETAWGRKPVGIITDRDIVIEVAAMGVPLSSVSAEDVMAPDLLIGSESDPIWGTVARMRDKGV